MAVAPIIGGRAVKGPTAKIMSELGLKVDAAAVAHHYGRLLDGYVVDHGDVGLAGPWAAAARPGDPVRLLGPGGAYAPDEGADDQRGEGGHQRHSQRGAGAVHQAAEDVAPEAVGAEEKELIPFFTERLKADPDFEVRVGIADELGSLGPAGKDALPALRAAQTDSQIKVRAAAAAAIKQIEKPVSKQPD